MKNSIDNQELELYEKYFQEWESKNFHLILYFHRILIILLLSFILKVIIILFYKTIDILSNPYLTIFFAIDLVIFLTFLIILLISIFNRRFQKFLIKKFFFSIFPNLDLRSYIKKRLISQNSQFSDQIKDLSEQWNFNVKKEIQLGNIFLIGLIILDYFQYILLIQVLIL